MSDIMEREHTIGLFDELVVRGAGTVQIVSGPNPHLVVVGPDDLADRVVVRYRNARLVVSFRIGPNPVMMLPAVTEQLRTIIVTDSLSKLVVQGAATVELGESEERPFNVDSLKLIHSGAGAAVGTVSATELEVRLRGMGSIMLAGDCDRLHARVSGIGSMDCMDLVCKRAFVGLSGVGSGKVMVLDELKASVSGTGRLSYRGTGRLIRRGAGPGRIEHVE